MESKQQRKCNTCKIVLQDSKELYRHFQTEDHLMKKEQAIYKPKPTKLKSILKKPKTKVEPSNKKMVEQVDLTPESAYQKSEDVVAKPGGLSKSNKLPKIPKYKPTPSAMLADIAAGKRKNTETNAADEHLDSASVLKRVKKADGKLDEIIKHIMNQPPKEKTTPSTPKPTNTTDKELRKLITNPTFKKSSYVTHHKLKSVILYLCNECNRATVNMRSSQLGDSQQIFRLCTKCTQLNKSIKELIENY